MSRILRSVVPRPVRWRSRNEEKSGIARRQLTCDVAHLIHFADGKTLLVADSRVRIIVIRSIRFEGDIARVSRHKR